MEHVAVFRSFVRNLADAALCIAPDVVCTAAWAEGLRAGLRGIWPSAVARSVFKKGGFHELSMLAGSHWPGLQLQGADAIICEHCRDYT